MNYRRPPGAPKGALVFVVVIVHGCHRLFDAVVPLVTKEPRIRFSPSFFTKSHLSGSIRYRHPLHRKSQRQSRSRANVAVA